MKYGATFKIDIYDYDEERGEELVTRASDYLQMQMWGSKAKKGIPEEAGDLYGNYAIVWFALKREGRLGDYGLEDAPLTTEALDQLASRVSVYVSLLKDDELPLKGAQKR